MANTSEIVDREIYESIVHAIGEWLDENHLYSPPDKYFALSKAFYEHFVPDAPGTKEDRESRMRKLFEAQFVVEESSFERERQSNINTFQRLARVGLIAATGATLALFFSSIGWTAPITNIAVGVLLIGAIVNFVVIPILRRQPRHKERVRKERADLPS